MRQEACTLSQAPVIRPASPIRLMTCSVELPAAGSLPSRRLGANAFDRRERRSFVKLMNVDDIRKRLEFDFVPFKIHTSDGGEFKVPHREFVFVTQRRVVVADRKGYVNVLDPLHIVSIEENKMLPSS